MPQVQLEEISFSHSGAKPGGSVTIQQGGETVTAPEWQHGKENPEDSLVAYAFGQKSQPITINVRLSSPELRSTQVEVQAIADADNVLGNVQQRTVEFDSKGRSQTLPFTIPTPKFREFGVNRTDGSWSWQYQVQAGGPWVPFETTTHRIYVLVNTPVEPWDTELPWVEVLDRSCVWARGAKTDDEAASRITEEVHRLGERGLVTYSEYATYAHGTFDLFGFLTLLRNGVGSAQTVNCDDCATIVTTFSNILGCILFQSEMGNLVRTHYVNLIGEPKWRRPTFPRHAVAWKAPCLAADLVFDACLKFDTDGHPEDHSSFKATIPTNTPFAGRSNYRFCLFRRGTCDPQPEEKIRRRFGRGFLGQIKETDRILLALLTHHYGFETWPRDEPEGEFVTAPLNDLLEVVPGLPAFEGWERETVEEFENEDLAGGRLFFKRNDIITRNLVDVNAYVMSQADRSNEFVLQLLAQSHQLNMKRETTNPLGRLTFVAPGDKVVIFVREHVVVVVRSIGKEAVKVFAMAKTIDKYLAWKTSRKENK